MIIYNLVALDWLCDLLRSASQLTASRKSTTL